MIGDEGCCGLIFLWQQFLGRILRVNFSDKPKPKEPLYPETEHKLFVGNLSWSVTSESLGAAFQEYGNVVGARVLYDGETADQGVMVLSATQLELKWIVPFKISMEW